MTRIFSCRTSVYGDNDITFERLPEAGLSAVELSYFEPDTLAAIAAKAAQSGIQIATLGTGIDLTSQESVERYRDTIRAAADNDVKRIFTSISSKEEQPREQAIQALRGLAQLAESAGVAICMETHLPFGHNGDVAMRTLADVGCPALQVNYDTANIFYYNENVDAIEELNKVRGNLGSLHLKDTDGAYHSMNFPVLGEGVVEFARVFEICDGVGFTGPYTMELEGPLTDGKSVDERHAAVKSSMDYLRSLGVA